MKQLLIVSIAALTAAAVLLDDAAARTRRPRVVIRPAPLYDTEPGAIYGYAPGTYRLGANGVLYGPYPLNPRIALSYGVGPNGEYGPGPAWYREQYAPGWFGWYGPQW